MAQFPLVLAIEPRLLPLARQNGFNMDRKVSRGLCSFVGWLMTSLSQYRNFVFRRMFEKPAIMFESRADEIVQNVRELSRLDPEYESVPLREPGSYAFPSTAYHVLCVCMGAACSSAGRSRPRFAWKQRQTSRRTRR